MGKFLATEFAIARETFEEASDAIHVDLKTLCFDGSEADLSLTHNTQPALLTVSTATYRVLESLVPLNLVAAAGHSVGEYAALVNAQSLKFGDAVKAVRERGEAMQSAVKVGLGGMAAIMGADEKQVRDLCGWASRESGLGVVEPANFNAPGQIVMSGHKTVIEWIQTHFTPTAFAGAPTRLKLIPLKVSAPFHCSLMAPAEKHMARILSEVEFQEPKYPIVQNVSAQAVRDPEILRANLISQISKPVRWVECVQTLKSLGSRRLIEMGSGKVLAGLAKKIDGEALTTFNINSLDELRETEKILAAQG